MPLITTAVTGRSTPESKTDIGYAVGHDIRLTYDPQSAGHTVTLTVSGEDTKEFAREMLGYAEIAFDEITGNKILHRVLPEPSGRDQTCYCVKLESVQHIPDELELVEVPPEEPPEEPPPPPVYEQRTKVNDAGWPTYKIESFQATFVRPLYDVREDNEIDFEHERFCVWRTRLVAQNEKMPGGGYKIVDDAVLANRIPLNEVGVKTGRTLELTCKWLDVPFFDYERLKTLCNKVNSVAVSWDGSLYDAECVLFTGVDSEPRMNAAGDRITYDITFSFAVRTDGRTWNKFWVRSAGVDKYVLVSDNGLSTGNKVFGAADLNNLWALS